MVPRSADKIKELGFTYATRSGTTVGISDITVPPTKQSILADAEKQVEQVEQQHRAVCSPVKNGTSVFAISGLKLKDDVTQAMIDNLDPFNPVWMMANSGARVTVRSCRSWQACGLVADPTGRTIEIPIKANFREGLTVLSTSSPLTVHARAWPIPLYVPPTRVISLVV